MTQKGLISLIVATVVLGVLASVALKDDAKVTQAQDEVGSLIAPKLAKDVNDVKRIIMSRAGNDVIASFAKVEDQWVAEHKNNYPIELSDLKKAIIALSKMKIVEKKTASEQFYEQLSLNDVSKPDSKAFRAQIFNSADEVVADVHIGIRAMGKMSEDYHYVRRTGEAQSWMATPILAFAESESAWLKKSLVDIKQTEIKSVSVTLADGQSYEFLREDEDATLNLTELPEGKQQASDSVGNAIAGVLAGFKFENIPDQSTDVLAENYNTARFETFDGVVISILHKREGDDVYASLSAESIDDNEETSSDTQNKVDSLNKQWDGWVYLIPLYKHKNLVKPIAELVTDITVESESD